ncbi:MAG: outer membrane protein assembly factor BamE [Pseudomonadota bacterium]|nr:outer membrane protein assembly factor BamE [Pseudomonadota bacterium]MEE3070666.1 outer membrane protein assembly factor BamE [Pseudomonadota bacterium]
MRVVKWIGRSAVLAIALTVAGCVAQYNLHGYTPSDEDLAGIVVGVDTRDSVEELVGPPSTAGVARSDAYYYVSKNVRHYGIRPPQTVDRQIVAIRFDQAGVVSNIERYTLDDGRVVTLSRRVTGSNVNDTPFLKQLFGNIGGLDLSQALQ